MNIRDYRKFADQFNYNVGDWKFRDKEGTLHDLIVLEMTYGSGYIIFEIDDHTRCKDCQLYKDINYRCEFDGTNVWDENQKACEHFKRIER